MEQYMRRCFELAKLGLGNIKTNPSVGCVIVHDGKIIGEGYHKKYGEAHAEVNAVNSVPESLKHLLPKSEMYVTLEPCFHYGKTPPCVNLILRHKIPKVIISCIDPNPKVSGRSIEKLRSNGVEVITGLLEKEGRFVTRRFFTKIQKKRPYIILKYAKSRDGFLGKPNQQIWITGPMVKRLDHRWRHEEMGILVGTNTALVDDPQLTNRLWTGNTPIRMVMDRQGRLPKNLKLLDDSTETLVFIDKSIERKSTKNIIYHPIDFSKNSLQQALQIMYERRIMSVVVEGGALLLNSFIKQGLWDEARVLEGSVNLGSGLVAPTLNEIEPQSIHQVGKDKLYLYYKDF